MTAKELLYQRRREGIALATLAKLSGVDRALLSLFEKGRYRLDENQMSAIENAMDGIILAKQKNQEQAAA